MILQMDGAVINPSGYIIGLQLRGLCVSAYKFLVQLIKHNVFLLLINSWLLLSAHFLLPTLAEGLCVRTSSSEAKCEMETLEQ